MTVRPRRLAVATLAALSCLPLAAARSADEPASIVGPAGDDCVAESFFVRAPGSSTTESLPAPDLGAPMLRFVQLSDSHILDDEASAVMTGNVLDPLLQLGGNTSAQRLQEEFTDEVLDDMEARINECQSDVPSAFMLATGDLTDNMTLNELRRYIDNLDGAYAAPTAFEHYCGYRDGVGLTGRPSPKTARTPCADDEANATLAGRTVADSQAPTPDPDGDPTYVPEGTRTPRQLIESSALAIADGSYTAAPGLPEVLRENHRLSIPHYAVFGNHDGAVRGTVAYQDGFQTGARAFGRYFTGNQREFINEFFFTSTEPRGHGFNHAGQRLLDDDPRNDGWYAFVEGGVRIVVLNTIIDGVTDDGSPFRDPSALEKGGVSAEQLAWLDAELADADRDGQPALVFSHHPTRSFHDAANGAAVDAVLERHPSLLAHLAGHTHENRVRSAGTSRPFWQVETASLVDWPQEGRIVEVHRLASGGHALRMTMIEPVRDSAGSRSSFGLSQAEAECITGRGETSPEPSDGGEASVRSLYCRADRTLSEGGPHERDVILLVP